LHVPPKFSQIGIFGLKTNHLAALDKSDIFILVSAKKDDEENSFIKLRIFFAQTQMVLCDGCKNGVKHGFATFPKLFPRCASF
jgi:hypothetical protein